MGSIEEDINEIEKIKDLLKFLKGHGWIPNISKTIDVNKTIKAIEHILHDYTRQKQINEEQQKINGELREKVKELDTKNDELLKDLYSANCIIADLTDSIPKQKIKDRFEKIQLLYEKNLKEVDLKEVQKIDKKIFEGIRLEAQKDFARELLQESEDK